MFRIRRLLLLASLWQCFNAISRSASASLYCRPDTRTASGTRLSELSHYCSPEVRSLFHTFRGFPGEIQCSANVPTQLVPYETFRNRLSGTVCKTTRSRLGRSTAHGTRFETLLKLETRGDETNMRLRVMRKTVSLALSLSAENKKLPQRPNFPSTTKSTFPTARHHAKRANRVVNKGTDLVFRYLEEAHIVVVAHPIRSC